MPLGLKKPPPVKVTIVPAGPDVGVMAVTTGGLPGGTAIREAVEPEEPGAEVDVGDPAGEVPGLDDPAGRP